MGINIIDRNLNDELRQLAGDGTVSEFNDAQDIGGLSGEERKTALPLKNIPDSDRAASEYDLMKYKLASDALGVAHWDIEITNGDPVNPDNRFIWSPELRRMFGFSECDDLSDDFSDVFSNWLDRLHPDDRDEALRAYVAHTTDRTGNTPFDLAIRIRMKNGEYRHVRTFGTTLRNKTGEPLRVAGAMKDLTDQRKRQKELVQREKTLSILNCVALILLTRGENDFTNVMSEGLNLIARMTDIDRMSVFRNSNGPDGLHLSQIYRWSKKARNIIDVRKELKDVPYANFSPLLEPILTSGEYFSGQVSQMPGNEAFMRFGCVTVLAIPIFDDGKFWGFTFFERFQEKDFTEQDTEVLHSASFMLVNAVIRNEEATAVREAHEQSQLMVDAAPLVITFVNKELDVIDCSWNAVDTFGFSSKQELMERLAGCAPEYQPCGKRTVDTLASAADKAFRTGKAHLEWTLLTAGGEAIAFDTMAVRVKYKDDYALMLYSRDVREEKKILTELTAHEKQLVSQAEEIRQANEFIQLMLDSIPMSITMWDKNHNVIDCSQYAVNLFGYSTKQELLAQIANNMPEYQPCGKPSRDILAEKGAEAFRTGSSRCEWTQLTASGEPVLLDAKAIRIKHKHDYFLMLCSRDIRDEKRMLSELAQRDEMLMAQAYWYKSILDGIPLPLSVTDADMRLTYTNAAALKIFGKRNEELIGQHCHIWDCPICDTENCSIVRARQGNKHSFFKTGGMSCKVDTEIIRDLAGDTIGHLEVLHDITEVENLARQQADAANEAKSAFLATMSHEMRTPLSAVIGLSELILENGGLSQENEEYLDKIFNAGSTLLSIVNDILDISKIEAGRFDIIPQEYDVPGMINDVITQNILRIHSKPVHFSLNINEKMPVRLYGDDIRVKQVISNLLSNAFKYTDKGTVELSAGFEREGDSVWAVFKVSDTGLGIKPADLERLFTDYTRFDEAVNRKNGGTGLGLSISKRLVELMDGNITVESEYGKGSVFTARIRQQPAGDAAIGREMAEHLRNFLYTTNRRRIGAQLNRIQIPYARVLVVDDNPTNLDIARGLIQPYGMEIDCLTNGQAAIDTIREEKNKYNAIFMDHMMPGLDGMETVRIIREEIGSEYAKTVPIVALTANAISGNKERFISNGFNAFLAKPIDIFQLDAVIRKWVRDKDKEDEQGGGRAFVERRRRPDRRKDGDRRIGERRRANAPVPAYSQVIEGLDWMQGIERLGGEDSFRQILRSFAVNTRPLLALISEPGEETLPEYAITVHGIKGSSRGICATPLGSMAESLEFAAKDDNFDFVSLHNPDFLKMAYQLIEAIEALLEKTDKAGAKPRKDRPDNAELEKLRTFCDNYDLDGIEAVMHAIDEYEYTADDGLTEWLRENVARLNYARVMEKIAQVTKTI